MTNVKVPLRMYNVWNLELLHYYYYNKSTEHIPVTLDIQFMKWVTRVDIVQDDIVALYSKLFWCTSYQRNVC